VAPGPAPFPVASSAWRFGGGRGGECIEGGAHRPRVARRRPAAAADEPRPGFDRPPRELPEVLRRRAVDHPPTDPRRPARVRHHRQGRRGGRPVPRHRRDHRQDPLRPDRAVGAESGDAERRQRVDHLLRRRAAEGPPVFGEGHQGDDRQVARRLGGGDRLLHLLQQADRLQDQEIDPALQEGLDLLPEGGADRGRLGRPDRRQGPPRRPDRAGDQGRAAGDLARLAGETDAPLVDVAHLAVEPERLQLEPVGAERVGLDQLRPRR